ncbi:MAG: DUF4097 family beta strand repeat protein [Ignavibacterium sp.]|nr:MAG: DUF4097 family beta strand repeat protein [Ignavibacterium sp.]
MKTRTNTILSTLFVLFALLVSFGCADISVNPTADINGPGVNIDQKYKASESFSNIVVLSNQTTIKVEGINGTVNVQSVSGTNQITLSGEKVVRADTYQNAYSHLKDIAIEINELTDKVLVKTVQPNYSNGRSYSVNYTISIPSHLNVVVNNVNGEINGRLAMPLNGTIAMSLQNGNIKLNLPRNTSAEFYASLANGSISLQDLTLHNRVASSKSLQGRFGDGQGMITLRTTNGNIHVAGF